MDGAAALASCCCCGGGFFSRPLPLPFSLLLVVNQVGAPSGTGGSLESEKDSIVPGATVFLYNSSNRTLLGIFEAASAAGYNLGE